MAQELIGKFYMEYFGCVRTCCTGDDFESCRPVVIDHDILCDEQEPGVEFQIILRRHGGRQGKKDSVGLDVDWGDMERLVITKVKANGLVADWNRDNPAQPVSIGDSIVEVNGARGDAKSLLNEVKYSDAEVLSMVIQKHSLGNDLAAANVPEVFSNLPRLRDKGDFRIAFLKRENDAFGVNVDFGDLRKLVITSIKPGLVATWNQENPAQTVSIGDAIVQINDKRGDAKELLAVVKHFKSGEVSLVIEKATSKS